MDLLPLWGSRSPAHSWVSPASSLQQELWGKQRHAPQGGYRGRPRRRRGLRSRDWRVSPLPTTGLAGIAGRGSGLVRGIFCVTQIGLPPPPPLQPRPVCLRFGSLSLLLLWTGRGGGGFLEWGSGAKLEGIRLCTSSTL